MQEYADIYLLQSHYTCFGCHSTPSSDGPDLATLGGKYLYRYFDLYRSLGLQFLVLLMMGTVTTETCKVTLQ